MKKQYNPFLDKYFLGGLFDKGDDTKKIDSVLKANKKLDWVQSMYDKNPESIQIPGQDGLSSHFMESSDGKVYPTVRKINGKLQYLGDKARDYADSTKSFIQFPTDKEAQWFSKNYKSGTNVLKQEYSLGGMMDKLPEGTGAGIMGMAGGMLSGLIPSNKQDGSTSIGGSVAGGALKGMAGGAALGPIGMIGGAALGGLTSLIQAKQQQKAEEEARIQEQNQTSRSTLANMQYGVANSSNLPMAMGGQLNPMDQTPIGDFSNFGAGGTHEQNPNGGIPQGYNAQGQLRTVEQGEAGFKFKEGKYIFSNRLNFE